MKLSELPEEYKKYILMLSNGSEYVIDGKQKNNLINSPLNFIELTDGSTINKAFIVEIKFHKEETRSVVELNKGNIKKLLPDF